MTERAHYNVKKCETNGAAMSIYQRCRHSAGGAGGAGGWK